MKMVVSIMGFCLYMGVFTWIVVIFPLRVLNKLNAILDILKKDSSSKSERDE